MSRQTIRLRLADAPARHLEVIHTVHDAASGDLALRMPVWCPGSYVVRDYAGHVSRFAATAGERELAFTKTDTSTWVVTVPEAGDVSVRYRVFAPELTVRTNDVTPDHAFIHPPAAFLWVEGRTDEAIQLEVDAPAGWTVSTALPRSGDGFEARDVDHLYDSPLEIGTHDLHCFDVAGRPHELAIYGTHNLDVERAVADVEKIVATELAFFGDEPPYDRYLFILHCVSDRGGGLEHDDSCVLAWTKLEFRPEAEYRKFLTLVAHEFLHVWHVRRTRPSVLMDYDYQRAVTTRLLWVFEGFTTYYDEIFPVRAGCYGAKEMLEQLAEHVALEATCPGGNVQSLEASSFDTWVGLYHPTPDSRNSQTNYYLKGMLVAWKLDLLLRARTQGKRSLDDVMRHLWTDYGRAGRGVDEGAMGAIVAKVTGVDIEDFLEEHVRRPGRMDYTEALATVGLQLRRKPRPATEPEPAWLGATSTACEGGVRLNVVYHEGPAHAAGMMARDVLVALDGHRLGRDLDGRMKTFGPGDVATWTAFRDDRLVDGRITFGEDPIGKLEIVPVDEPTDAQREAFAQWAGSALDDLRASDPA